MVPQTAYEWVFCCGSEAFSDSVHPDDGQQLLVVEGQVWRERSKSDYTSSVSALSEPPPPQPPPPHIYIYITRTPEEGERGSNPNPKLVSSFGRGKGSCHLTKHKKLVWGEEGGAPLLLLLLPPSLFQKKKNLPVWVFSGAGGEGYSSSSSSLQTQPPSSASTDTRWRHSSGRFTS